MIPIDTTTWRAARRALEEAVALHIENPDVAFIDLGFTAPPEPSAEFAVRIHRRRKRADTNTTGSTNTKTAEAPEFAVKFSDDNFRFHWHRRNFEDAPPTRSELAGGLPIAGEPERFFTLGGKVRDRQTRNEMILSSWHVLAGTWARGERVLIYQPAAPNRGAVAEFTRNAISRGLDAAVSGLARDRRLLNEQCGIGAVTGVALPQLGMSVVKAGAGTGVTTGVITGILGYSMQRYANRQQLIGPFVCITPENPAEKICAPGDSGAWWLESATRRAVALHFAGGDQPNFALAFSMPEVLEALDVEIDTTIAPVTPVIEPTPAALEKIAVAAVEPAPTTVMQIDGSNLQIDSPVRDVILAVDWEMIDSVEPETTEPWRHFIGNTLRVFIWNKLQPAAQRFANFGFAATTRALYRLAQATLVVAAAMTMIGFNRRLTNEHQQREGQIVQLQKQLHGLTVIAKIDSARQQEIWRIVAIIDRFNPEMNSEVKLNLAAEIYALSLRYHQLDVDLICAVITHESAKSWDPEVVSFAGAMGLMQLLPSTAVGLAQQEGITWTSAENILFDPVYNVRLGCRYLAGMVAKHGLEAGLAGYNGGPVQAGRWLRRDNALPPETTSYVPQVIKQYRQFQQTRPQKPVNLTEVTDFPKG